MQIFSVDRQKSIKGNDDRPGKDWICSIVQRSDHLRISRGMNVELSKAEAMKPQNVASHFARIRSLCAKNDINDPLRIFNDDESGFSIRRMTLGSSKYVV